MSWLGRLDISSNNRMRDVDIACSRDYLPPMRMLASLLPVPLNCADLARCPVVVFFNACDIITMYLPRVYAAYPLYNL